ncbi:SRPBCC family protein [Thalassorhabdomicrobium marinisediminis]|uniref:Polyketide cyclase n=1 Tax=Thalassorhabdomicrobium marinisediminis TaxID=2170577 RepID=A0A2T7FY98_9RHOB|nr:SRPBCC family protein [Thalassorhabdomicrobium marinisediminis]PVA07141.1 polyketide cyclase [Thalassorhabdomicrobium marinisediminis]
MTDFQPPPFDPARDLQLEQHIKARPETIWRCWAEPELFKQWFTPKPVEVTRVDNDLRPGGRAFTEMKLPDGTLMPNDGCFVLVEAPRLIVMTDSMTQGFRPTGQGFMTAIITLTPDDAGTLYRVQVLHAEPDARERHEKMGFHDGWGTTARQLADLAASLG